MKSFASLPATNAFDAEKVESITDNISISYTGKKDEQALYKELNERLISLETSTERNCEALVPIKEETQALHVLVEEKEELAMRVDWLERLYKAANAVDAIQTKDEAKQIDKLITGVQTCPLKTALQTKLEELMNDLPADEATVSIEDILMDQAIEKCGDAFINLGSAGRDAIIADAAVQGGELDVEMIRARTEQFEEEAEQLKECRNATELACALDKIPLSSWADFDEEKKQLIAAHLMKHPVWNGLAMLDRMIEQQNRAIQSERKSIEQEKYLIDTPAGKAAAVTDSSLFNNIDRS